MPPNEKTYITKADSIEILKEACVRLDLMPQEEFMRRFDLAFPTRQRGLASEELVIMITSLYNTITVKNGTIVPPLEEARRILDSAINFALDQACYRVFRYLDTLGADVGSVSYAGVAQAIKMPLEEKPYAAD